jgi:antitoxin ParD1/3/4
VVNHAYTKHCPDAGAKRFCGATGSIRALYQNASEVLRDGLRLVQAREREQEARLEALRRATAEGIGDVEAGRYAEFDSESALEAHLQELTEQAIAKE